MRHIASVYKRTKSTMSGNINYILSDSSLLKKEGNSESMVRMAVSVGRDQLASVGTCFGKFTKTGKFKLHITALDYLAQYAKYKIWIKPNGEMPFLYGNHIVKAHLGRITDDTPEHTGVVIFSMSDSPLGFGVTARSTVDMKRLQPTDIIVFHQADVGEYLRDEDTLF
ncbi:Putative 60S ribosome subunit biogenesis protein NIP7 [Rhizopus microsporus]|nr:Putative 60S ribosome subunit biogenesis protein NIP7 [Rhizopus microsporus]